MVTDQLVKRSYIFNTCIVCFWKIRNLGLLTIELHWGVSRTQHHEVGPFQHWPCYNGPGALTAGCAGREELWFSVVSLGEATFRLCLFPQKYLHMRRLSWKQRRKDMNFLSDTAVQHKTFFLLLVFLFFSGSCVLSNNANIFFFFCINRFPRSVIIPSFTLHTKEQLNLLKIIRS